MCCPQPGPNTPARPAAARGMWLRGPKPPVRPKGAGGPRVLRLPALLLQPAGTITPAWALGRGKAALPGHAAGPLLPPAQVIQPRAQCCTLGLVVPGDLPQKLKPRGLLEGPASFPVLWHGIAPTSCRRTQCPKSLSRAPSPAFASLPAGAQRARPSLPAPWWRWQEQCCPVRRAPRQCCSCCRLQQPLWGWDCSWTMGQAVQTQAGCFACAGGAEQSGTRCQDASGSNTSGFPDGAPQVASPGRS